MIVLNTAESKISDLTRFNSNVKNYLEKACFENIAFEK